MKKIPFILISALILAGCADDQVKISLKNSLPIDRTAETVEIPIADITAKLTGSDPSQLVVTDSRRHRGNIPADLRRATHSAVADLPGRREGQLLFRLFHFQGSPFSISGKGLRPICSRKI